MATFDPVRLRFGLSVAFAAAFAHPLLLDLIGRRGAVTIALVLVASLGLYFATSRAFEA